MSFLTDTDLNTIICSAPYTDDESKLVIYPYDERYLTPVGYDLRVGNHYATSKKLGTLELRPGKSLTLPPKSTCLIETLEDIQMPRNKKYSGFIESKVSKVSKGLSHISTTVDPDWNGILLIAVHNHSNKKIELEHGETFCTMVVLENLSASTKNCKKPSGRTDILLAQFSKEVHEPAWTSFISPITLILISALGYLLFGNNVGFSAMVVLGVAISQIISDRFS